MKSWVANQSRNPIANPRKTCVNFTSETINKDVLISIKCMFVKLLIDYIVIWAETSDLEEDKIS